MGPRAGLDGRIILSPLGFDPGPSSPYSVAIPTELPGPLIIIPFLINKESVSKKAVIFIKLQLEIPHVPDRPLHHSCTK